MASRRCLRRFFSPEIRRIARYEFLRTHAWNLTEYPGGVLYLDLDHVVQGDVAPVFDCLAAGYLRAESADARRVGSVNAFFEAWWHCSRMFLARRVMCEGVHAWTTSTPRQQLLRGTTC